MSANKWLKRHWAIIPVCAFYLCAALVFVLAGGRAQIGIPDNLDLFQAQYQMLKNTHTFSARFASAPFLHGISRDVLPSERSLEALLYRLLPSLPAYIGMYFVKITIAMVSFTLLAEELGKRKALGNRADTVLAYEDHEDVWNLAVLCGLAYGILNLFPSFGIAFASIPLLIWMALRLERETETVRVVLWLAGIACYPFLSYFSYFGIFLIGYLFIAFLWKSIADSFRGKRNPADPAGRRGKRGFHPDLRLLLAAIVLGLGSVFFEYRLFRQMLLSDEASIRDSMVQTSLSAGGICRWIGSVLVNGVEMHAESVQKYLVLPVCTVYFFLLNLSYIRKHKARLIVHDVYNLGVLLLLFNSIVYGLYYSEGFRSAVETAVPPLKGFQFNRTAFFNPFLWYGLFFLAMYRLLRWIRRETAVQKDGRIMVHSAKYAEFETKRRRTPLLMPEKAGILPWVLTGAAVFIIVCNGNTYNDLLNTAKADARRMLGRPESNSLNYDEFYSTQLFDQVKADIGYDGEWSAAYGFHPAVLEYNGIATLDGYLGFYPESYKTRFRKVIAPALEENEASREYFDEWGARCYLYSGHNPTVVEAVRNYPHPEDTIDIDPAALRDLGCRYVFSRIRITNAEEKDLCLVGEYTDETSPYIIYTYELKQAALRK